MSDDAGLRILQQRSVRPVTGEFWVIRRSIWKLPIGLICWGLGFCVIVKLCAAFILKRLRKVALGSYHEIARSHQKGEDGTVGIDGQISEHFAGRYGASFGEVIVDKGYTFVRYAHVLAKSVSSNLMLSPQPQASTTLGFLNLKPDSSKLVS